MQCPKCGADLRGGAESCPGCGERVTNVSPGQTNAFGVATARRKLVYAGFWLRAVAYLIDSFILGFALSLALRPILLNNHVGPSVQEFWGFYTSYTRQSTAFVLMIQLADWLYSAGLESSAWQATLGKKMLGLKVTDLTGQRLSFARATGRHFGKYLSSLTLLIGFAMAGFTGKKQALHDLIAKTLVVRII